MVLNTWMVMRMNSTNYKQYDTRWGGLGYPKKPWYIKNCGCGEVAICNAIIEMANMQSQTPKTIQPYCKQFAEPHGNGTYHSGIPAMMKHYGLTEVKEHSTMPSLFKELAKGNRVAILLMGSKLAGTKKIKWTSSGHFICATGFKIEKSKNWLYIKDSNSSSASRNGWLSYEESLRNACYKVWSGKLNGSVASTPSTPTTSAPKNDGKLVVDGIGGAATVNRLQEFLGVTKTGGITIRKDLQKYVPALKAYEYGSGSPTVKAMQRWLGIKQDGIWGKNTSVALQKELGVQADGVFGPASVKALQSYLNTNDKAKFPTSTSSGSSSTGSSATISTGASKIVARAKDYAWAYGTASSKYSYSKGSAKSSYKSALKKYMGKTSKVAQSDCGYFVTTCVRASGVSSSFLALKGVKETFPSVPSTMQIVHKGKKIPDGLLQPGDIIRYKKTNGKQHALMIYSSGKIAEAGREHQFPAIEKDTKKYNKSNVKFSTLQVLRAK